MESDLPKAFEIFKEYIRNDLRIITGLEHGSPNYAAALLITVASEALSRMLGRSKESVFVDDLLGKYNVSPLVCRILFDAVRNGLAHLYDTKVIVLEDLQEPWILVAISWKTNPHLSVIDGDWVHDGNVRPAVCLNVQTMWRDLDSLIGKLEIKLKQDNLFRQNVETNIMNLDLEIPLTGEAAQAWREYIVRETGH